MNSSIKARLASLQAIAAQKQEGVAMVDAFKQAMAESGGGATTVVIQLDGKEIARSTVKNINNMTRAAGKPVLLY